MALDWSGKAQAVSAGRIICDLCEVNSLSQDYLSQGTLSIKKEGYDLPAKQWHSC